MIIRALAALKEVFIPKSELGEKNIECAVDDDLIDCTDLQEDYDQQESFEQDAIDHYTGVPAPAYLDDDPWFGPAPIRSEKQLEYMEMETEMRMVAEKESLDNPCESHDIHAKMYEIATKNWTTVAETQGGSENFQEGPGGWNSGTGLGQFQR
jgi:hypothetical protein